MNELVKKVATATKNIKLTKVSEIFSKKEQEQIINNFDPVDEFKWVYNSLLDSEYDDTIFVLNYDPYPKGVI